MMVRRFYPVMLVVALAFASAAAAAQTWTAEQKEIWAFEDLQWKMEAAKDSSWIDKMVHPNLSYWDVAQPAPQNKASLQKWVRYGQTNNTVLEQELFPIACTITGNVAVVQYRYEIASENYKKERETVTGRYTDILIKDGGRWQFIAWAGGEDPKK
jgi:type II secretory pathway pseudopilin PulG